MKKKTKIIIASSVVLLGAAAVVAGYCVLKNKNVELPEGFTVTAHTGCEGTADNSLEAIKAGYESGADIVEFDLNFAQDGTPVLAHDKAEADSVTLDEAFAFVAQCDGLKVNVDVKTTLNLKAVAELAEKYGITDRIFYTGIDENAVEAVKEQTPDISYYLNVAIDKSRKNNREYLLSLAQQVIDLGAVGINLYYGDCPKQLVEIFHERGLLVSVWTVNTQLDMMRMLELCPDNITTRHPSTLIAVKNNKTNK